MGRLFICPHHETDIGCAPRKSAAFSERGSGDDLCDRTEVVNLLRVSVWTAPLPNIDASYPGGPHFMTQKNEPTRGHGL